MGTLSKKTQARISIVYLGPKYMNQTLETQLLVGKLY